MRKLTTEDGSPGHERGSTSLNRDPSVANDDWDDLDYD
jgi:hypothetical protein